jgi:hypothetical protein
MVCVYYTSEWLKICTVKSVPDYNYQFLWRRSKPHISLLWEFYKSLPQFSDSKISYTNLTSSVLYTLPLLVTKSFYFRYPEIGIRPWQNYKSFSVSARNTGSEGSGSWRQVGEQSRNSDEGALDTQSGRKPTRYTLWSQTRSGGTSDNPVFLASKELTKLARK